MRDSRISPTLRRIVTSELHPDERVRWTGMPKPIFFTKVATGTYALGMIWISACLFWMFGGIPGVYRIPADDSVVRLMSVAIVPFIFVGVAFLSAPLWAYRNARRTIYVITDRRAIAFIARFSTVIRRFPPEQLSSFDRREHNDGTGDVILGQRTWRNAQGHLQREELGFHRVPDAKRVEGRLRELADTAS